MMNRSKTLLSMLLISMALFTLWSPASALQLVPEASTVTTTVFVTVVNTVTSTTWFTSTLTMFGILTTVVSTFTTSTVTVAGTFGTTSNAGTMLGGGANGIDATKYMLTQAGTVIQLSIYAMNAGNVKAAIYADNSGVPGTLMVANNVPTPVSAGQWNSVSITPTLLSAGTYWIAFSADGALRAYEPGGQKQTAYMVNYPYSSNMPATWTPSGYQSNDYICYATYT
jgi:hypothetical protein